MSIVSFARPFVAAFAVLAASATCTTAQTAAEPPAAPAPAVENAAPRTDLYLRMFAVTGKASGGARTGRCETPKAALDPDLDLAGIAAQFGGASAAIIWLPELAAGDPTHSIDGIARVDDSQLYLGFRGQRVDKGAWATGFVLQDIEKTGRLASQEFQIPSGWTSWFAYKYYNACVVVRVAVLAEGTPPPAALPQPEFVTRDMTAPVVVKKFEPNYPRAARQDERGGQALVQAVVGKDGHVTYARLLKYPPASSDLAVTAMAAVSKFKYTPAMRNGEPVIAYATVQVRFTIERPGR